MKSFFGVIGSSSAAMTRPQLVDLENGYRQNQPDNPGAQVWGP